MNEFIKYLTIVKPIPTFGQCTVQEESIKYKYIPKTIKTWRKHAAIFVCAMCIIQEFNEGLDDINTEDKNLKLEELAKATRKRMRLTSLSKDTLHNALKLGKAGLLYKYLPAEFRTNNS